MISLQDRRLRRSRFFLRRSLFSNMTIALIKEGADPSSLTKLAVGLAGVGLGAAFFKSLSKGDNQELDDPGGLEDVVKDPEAQPDATVVENLNKSDEISGSPTAKPEKSEEDSDFFSRLTKIFSREKPVITTPSSTVQGSKVSGATALTKLPTGFRGKFAFDGIAGATLLSEKGRYTQLEADTIVSLKTSKSNTGASGPMTKSIENLIRETASRAGVDPSLAVRVAKMESGGNPNAISKTGAIGIYQFTGGTASDFGITNRFDVVQNIQAGVAYLAKNATRGARLGIAVTPLNLYLMHQLGFSGAKELIKAAEGNLKIADLSPSLLKSVKLNYGGKSVTTVRQYMAKTEEALQSRDRSIKVVADSSIRTSDTAIVPPVTSVLVEKVKLPASIPSATPVIAKVDLKEVERSLDKPSTKRVLVTSTPKTPPEKRVQQKTKPQTVVKSSNGTLIAFER
jgi:Transglycosylase SLT domain